MQQKILAIDDNLYMLMSLEFLMKKGCCEVMIARNGTEALGDQIINSKPASPGRSQVYQQAVFTRELMNHVEEIIAGGHVYEDINQGRSATLPDLFLNLSFCRNLPG